MGLFNKKELLRISELEEENAKLQENENMLQNQIKSLGAKSVLELQREEKELQEKIRGYRVNLDRLAEILNIANDIVSMSERKIEISNEVEEETKKLEKLTQNIHEKKMELFDIEDDLTYQEFSLYRPKYDCMNSSDYAEKIKNCRSEQKKMIKEKTALNFYDNWVLDNSKAKGRAMNNDNMKMVLRAFNNECDAIINKVKFNNRDKIEMQIRKAASAIDKLNQRNKISITQKYISLKLQELDLVYEYQRKKQEEKELLREQREEEREQAKLQKEIEEQRKTIIKEQKHYIQAKEKYEKELDSCTDEQKEEIAEKIREINSHLIDVEKNLQDIDYREANKRAGYVYIISNIGSFGANIYKIGMTRRLNPQDRVDELGDASVPFKFDVHAMIFSDDAPTLENNLHKEFENCKVNMLNSRKEFFHVSLEEIKDAVKKYNENIIEIKDVPDAEQYRETLLIQKQMLLNQ